MPAKTATSSSPDAELAYLTRALKAPTMREPIPRLAARARADGWTHEEFLAACLEREVTARTAYDGELSVKYSKLPARKSLEEFAFVHAMAAKRDQVVHMGAFSPITMKDNVMLLGPPGTGKTHLAIALGIKARHAGHRVLFATVAEWVARLADAHHAGRISDEITRLAHYLLQVMGGIGYMPSEPEAANLSIQLISARYERASVIVTGNRPSAAGAGSSTPPP